MKLQQGVPLTMVERAIFQLVLKQLILSGNKESEIGPSVQLAELDEYIKVF